MPAGAPAGTVYQRRFTLRPGVDGGVRTLVAEMQDFCHHVRVTITHADGRIIAARGEGIRLPWSACPIGVAGVRGMAGLRVADARSAARWSTERTDNCTHATDLAMVALAHLDDTEPLTYEISVTPATGQVRTARLEAGGELVLEWTTDVLTLTAPDWLAGRTLQRADFARWSAGLDPALREAVTVLRRACHIAPSRDIDLDTMRVAADSIGPSASCHTLQPAMIGLARRIRGSSRAELTPADRQLPE
jgi:hypothetical protein